MSKQSRKLIRAAAQSGGASVSPVPATLVDDTDPYEAYADREWTFHFLPAADPVDADERALHQLMKAWRTGRASRRLSQVLGDAYFALFCLVILGAMVANVVLNQQRNAAGCTTEACLSGRTILPWAIVGATAVAALAASRLFGPVVASSAEGFWLMDAPVSRTRLLGRRLVAALVLAFAAGAAFGAVISVLAGSAVVAVAAWALACGATASGLTALSALAQTHDHKRSLRVLQGLAALGVVVLVADMVLIAAGRLSAPDLPTTVGPRVIAAVGAAVTAAAGVLAFGRLGHLRRARLASGGSLVSGMQGAMFALDFGLARDILVEREAMERGHVRPTPGRGTGARSLVWRDAQRLIRFPRPFLALIASALVPYAADALGLGFVMPFLAALALVAALIPFFTTLRVLSRTGGLARTFPFSTGELRRMTMIVPAVLAVAWALAIVPATLGWAGGTPREPDTAVITAVIIAAAGLFGAMRWVTAGQTDFNTPMLATGAGAMPPNLIFNLLRGLDVAATVTAPLILGLDPLWSVGIAAVWFFIVTNGKSMEEWQADAKEDRAALDAEKAARQAKKAGGATKTTIARPKR